MKTQRVRRLVVLAVAALLILSPSFPAVAGVDGVRIKGTVTYSTTPLPGVVVELRRDSLDGELFASTTSDGAGGYGFSNVPPGTFVLVAYGPSSDYLDFTAHMIIVSDLDLVEDIHLPKVMTLLSPPQDAVVSSTTPQFCWQGLPEATDYRFRLKRASDSMQVEYREGIGDTCYTTPHVLAVGTEYAWSVKAYDHLAHWIGASGVSFRFTVGAPSVKVSGTVYYSTTPLAGVALELHRYTHDGPLFASTTSDAVGAYQFSDVPLGIFHIRFYAPTAEFQGGSNQIAAAGSDIVWDIYLSKRITLLSPPQDSEVTAASPRFCWQGLPEATTYLLQLNRSSDWLLIETAGGITGTCYTTACVLEPGVQYTWLVHARDHLGHDVGYSPISFCFTYVPLHRRTYLPLAIRRESP